jgi:hypothetical protein
MKSTHLREVAYLLLLTVLLLGGGGVAAGGEPPLADAGLDQQVERNATVLLDAAGSRDADGTIRSYRWTIETPDGRTVQPHDADAPRTSFVARRTGRYEVTVTVTDDEGQTASDTLYVDVDPAATSPSSPAASDTTPGLTDSAEPASDGVVDPATPDAPLSVAPADSAGSGAAGTGVCPEGATSDGQSDCLEGDPPATVEVSGALYVRQGSVHTYTATVSDRPEGIADISWSGGLGSGYSATHLFTEPPGSTVRIAATVDDGEGHTSSDAVVVHVVTDNAPPEVRIEGPVATCVGEPVELEGYAIASEQHDEVVETTWHGDPTFVPQHPGQYVVGFSAQDTQAQTARTQHTVAVREKRVCSPEHTALSNLPGGTDKLLIRATDDNLVEGSRISSVMRARGNVPDSGPVEKLADVGAGLGRVGEGAAEHATGNEETLVFYMSAENASRLGQNIRTTPDDEVVAGANGPRINEHERLRNARVEDRVETERGRVKVVVRLGKDNTGNPDRFTGENRTDSDPAAAVDSSSERSQASQSGESPSPELSSNTDQTVIDNDPGIADTVSDITDPVGDAVESVGSLLGSDDAESDSGSGGSDTESRDPETEASSADSSESAADDDSGSSGGGTVPALDGIVDTSADESDGVGSDSSGSSGSSDSSDEPTIDGSDSWGGII